MSVSISANQNYIKLVSVSLALGWSVTPRYRFSLQNPSKKVLNIEMWMSILRKKSGHGFSNVQFWYKEITGTWSWLELFHSDNLQPLQSHSSVHMWWIELEFEQFKRVHDICISTQIFQITEFLTLYFS